MNIFRLSDCPVEAAQFMCDKHVRSKMQVESVQIMANCFSQEMLELAPKTQKGTTRKYSYFNHPCCIWARESKENLRWLTSHTLALFNERLFRWPDSKPHFSHSFARWVAENIDRSNNPECWPTLNPQAFGKENDHLKDDNPVMGYRNYYNQVKRHTIDMSWTNRDIPEWYLNYGENL